MIILTVPVFVAIVAPMGADLAANWYECLCGEFSRTGYIRVDDLPRRYPFLLAMVIGPALVAGPAITAIRWI